MRKNGRGKAIIFLLLIIVFLAVAVGGVSNLRNSVNNVIGGYYTGGNNTSLTVTTNVPVTTGVVPVHTCEFDLTKPYYPDKDTNPHYVNYLCKYPNCPQFKADYTKCVYNYEGYCNICGLEHAHSLKEVYIPMGDAEHFVYNECDGCDYTEYLGSGLCDLDDGICSVCGYECSHLFTGCTCMECGYDRPHSYSNGACIECSHPCPHSYTEAFYSTGDGTHDVRNECSICGYSESAGMDVSCSGENGICDYCGGTITN